MAPGDLERSRRCLLWRPDIGPTFLVPQTLTGSAEDRKTKDPRQRGY
jgi:hypothetical protein